MTHPGGLCYSLFSADVCRYVMVVGNSLGNSGCTVSAWGCASARVCACKSKGINKQANA